MSRTSKYNIFIVIPAYNEGVVIKNVIREVKRQGYNHIIVVDDGSSDDTYLRAKKEGVVALRHILNRGKGAAVKTGIEAAKMLGADIIVTLDGDGQHDPKDISKLLEKIKGKHDVVLGSRFLKKNKIPPFKVIANFLGNFITWIVYGIWVNDSQSGFRAYSRKAFSLMDTTHDRYEYDSEIIREIARNELRYTEIPIRVRYTSYSMNKANRQSLVNGIKTAVRMVISS